jgi:pseudaminic acid cytidylyltransferase
MKIGIIPARGGSKRIPRKNVKSFCGKPVIAYSIEALLKSEVCDRVVVSTDDEEIAAVAKDFGAEIPFFRPKELSDDHTPTVPVVRHAISLLTERWGAVTDVCCVYATAPFVTAEDIREAHSKLIAEQVSGYVFTATSFPFPIQRAFRIRPTGHCEMFHPEQYNTRSQDLEHAYQDAGQFYWGSAQAYLENKLFFSTDSKPFVIPRHRVQDIDTAQDWQRAEVMWRVLQEMRRETTDEQTRGE